MKYRVIFLKSARNSLAEIWLKADNRSEITLAAARIERELSIRPLQLGESRESSVTRTWINSPLAFDYEVIEDDKKVRVIHVWTI